jgi:hypothetical protein
MQSNKIVVSITTINSRLHLVKKVIYNLLEQSVLPHIIHIFYSTEPFLYDKGISIKEISELYEEICINNLTSTKIIFTNTPNIGPYRKLIPALKIYKNSIIITLDDDHLNEKDFIKKYIDCYNKTNSIICSGGRRLDLKNISNYDIVLSYMMPIDVPIMHFIPEGFGGILYHTNMFDEEFINFDYKSLPELVLKNDDVYFRLYTFNKGIHICAIKLNREHLLSNNDVSLYYDYNIKLNYLMVIDQINKYININSINIIDYDVEILNTRQYIIGTGTDVKQLQYEINIKEVCNDKINLKNILNIENNLIIINIEKDTKRYDSAVEEIKKLSFDGFVHLKATYWKEKDKMKLDLIFILDFLKKFNKNIKNTEITFNDFSEINDSNINIQDGPLGCYCSHVRAMIYGYLNFKDYTIIAEDDILVSNTEKIEKYIKCIPDDWDIITLNSFPINSVYNEPYYKYINTFHSTHFYIIKNKCLPKLFESVYPIYDQIDILIANLNKELNIYNIPNTVYQKNFSTNTQNNLYAILNSPGYHNIRVFLEELNKKLLEYVSNKLSNNNVEYNINITKNIISDVIYNYIINYTNLIDYQESILPEECCNRIYELIYIIINCCVKGINVDYVTKQLLNDINYILDCFNYHDPSNNTFAYNYGSTSNTYKIINNNTNHIMKVYNNKLRWSTKNHDNSQDIYDKELNILKKLVGELKFPQLISNNNNIIISYMGTSLYENFNLPEDWKEQIIELFKILDKCNIYYPEFNLKNIVVLNKKISFIDYGLASCDSTNNNNCKIFIELLEKIVSKFEPIKHNIETIQVLYKTFINNLKLEKTYENNIF